eukprot:9005979-Pyramimonas_sp.AAC.1
MLATGTPAAHRGDPTSRPQGQGNFLLANPSARPRVVAHPPSWPTHLQAAEIALLYEQSNDREGL